MTRYHLLDPGNDPEAAARRIGQELNAAPVDIAFVGIGENGHLAFNDPPADFETDAPYLIVNLDEACRRQQVNEGWFKAISEVPQQAISMSVKQILRAKEIVAVVPDGRKAQAVKACLRRADNADGAAAQFGRRLLQEENHRQFVPGRLQRERRRIVPGRAENAAHHRRIQLEADPRHRMFSVKEPAMAPGGTPSKPSSVIPSGKGSGS